MSLHFIYKNGHKISTRVIFRAFDCGLIKHLEYKARLELKERYSTPSKKVSIAQDKKLRDLSLADLMGVFSVFCLCLLVSTASFIIENARKPATEPIKAQKIVINSKSIFIVKK